MVLLEIIHNIQCPRTISSRSAMNSSSPVSFATGGKELRLLGYKVVRMVICTHKVELTWIAERGRREVRLNRIPNRVMSAS
jgi:hypothetical protein